MRAHLSLAVVLVALVAAPVSVQQLRKLRHGTQPAASRDIRVAYITSEQEDADSIHLLAAGRHVSLFRASCALRDLQWAPDGSRFACVLWAGTGRRAIAVVPAEGGEPIACTNLLGADDSPCWSPDSSRIAFSSGRDGITSLYAMNADCSGQRRLTRAHHRAHAPVWSPDGSRLAFQGTRGHSDEVCLVNADGRRERTLTHNRGFDGHPAWSPDASHLAFVSRRRGGGGLYLMRPDGSCQRALVRMKGIFWPAWSPDGRRIAFHGGVGPERGLWVVPAAGGAPTRLAPPEVRPASAGAPAWLPDSRRILFAGDSGDSVSLYCSDADTGALDRIQRNAGPVPGFCILPAPVEAAHRGHRPY